MGYLALYASTAATVTNTWNTAFGSYAGQNTTSGINNTVVGGNALTTNTTGGYNTAMGFQALVANTTASYNTAVGTNALGTNTTGAQNVAVGKYSLLSSTTASFNTSVGASAMESNSTGASNAAFGYQALQRNTTGASNTGIGTSALENNTTASNNVAVGYKAGYVNTGERNVYIGDSTATLATGSDNTGIGRSSLSTLTTGNGNVGLGDIGGGGQIFGLTTESNRIIAGHNAVSNAYVKVAWTVTSDARDKADISTAPYGLNFIQQLKPVTFKWDERSKYENLTPDGTHKGTKTQLGFLAQDVIALEESCGTASNDLLIADNEQDDKLKITETKLIPALVIAIQELKAEVDALKSQLNQGA
jgi:hypothetical protein